MFSTALADRRGWQLAPVVDWLLGEGRFIADPNTLTQALGERLTAAGAPVTRLRLMCRLLHPLLTAWSAIWEVGGQLQPEVVEPHGLDARASYVGSPMDHIARTRATFRRRLKGGLERGLGGGDHALLHALAAKGATDYLAVPLCFAEGRTGAMIVVTGRRGGFHDSDVRKLEALALALSPVMETLVAHRLADVIATAYIGPRAGARVLEGRIKRGDVETVRAAIWFSDVRGWSRLAQTLPPERAVALANDYFEVVEHAISAAGGEVLKLIGDAVLAIFPAEHGGAPGDRGACRAAIAAAYDAHAAAASRPDRLAFGVGLHLGAVVYGNVGAPARLDFTVMGEAVNLAARIETLCRTLAEPIVVSHALARASGVDCRDLGEHALAGWDAPVRVLAPARPGVAPTG